MRVEIATVIGIHLVALALGQDYYPRKDAVFGQVAIGEEIETVLNLTNRGMRLYEGSALFVKRENEIWNPLINGIPISEGEYPVRVPPQSTVTLRLSGDRLESGAAIIVSRDLILDNFLESNLTYYVRAGQKVVDSVGVSPSREFYLSSIPFENFQSIALALVNGDLSGKRRADVQFRLLAEDGSELATQRFELGPFFHAAQFLFELFPGIDLGRGKVEIFSDFPIFGTALILEQGELSSLPLEPSPVSYALRMVSSDGSLATGAMTLWAEGFFVGGYFRIDEVDQEFLEESVFGLVSGQLFDGFLQLSFPLGRDPFFSEEVTMYVEHENFSFGSEIAASTFVQTFLSDHATLGGTYQLTRVTD